MITFNASLSAILAAANTKSAWATALFSALGAGRSIVCKWKADETDVFGTGTTFYDADLTGTMSHTAGNVVDFGKVNNVRTQAAVDLATGYAVIRILGAGGHWIEGTIGLSGSGRDFILSANPTVTTGMGFGSAARLLAPRFLPSGTGPTAPSVTSLKPATLELWNWQDYTTPVLVGSLTFDTRVDDLVFDDVEIASNIGDVRVDQSSQSIVYAGFEFGATSFSINGSLNDELAGTPVYQVLVGCKPHGRWASWPKNTDYNIATDRTMPQAFKLRLLTATGTLLHTFEMHDGEAINDTRNTVFRTLTSPLKPPFNCAMMLPWQSHRLKPSSYRNKYFAGIETASASYGSGDSKWSTASNGACPLVWGRTQFNSYNHWWALPTWPLPTSDGYGATDTTVDPNADAGLFDVRTYYSGDVGSYATWLNDTSGCGAAKGARISGWRYDPGSISGHDMYSGPGGPRHDRAFMPTPIALALTFPTGTRPKGAELYRDMAHEWGLAYFNHCHHYLTDVKTFATVPDSEVITQGLWAHGISAYYGQSTYSTNTVNPFAIPNGGTRPTMGPENLPQYNGWSVDAHHNYCQPGLSTLFFNSPMHLLSAKLRYHANIMCQLGDRLPTSSTNWFGSRVHAWRWLHHVVAWKLGTSNALGIRRDLIENRFQAEIEDIHDTIWIPTIRDGTDTSNAALGRKNLGVAISTTVNDGTYTWLNVSTPLGCYMGGVLMLLKQTGLWSVMRGKSTKCQVVLDWILELYAKWTCDFMVHTLGRAEYDSWAAVAGAPVSAKVLIGNTPTLVTSWAEWASIYPRTGQESWLRNTDGSKRNERYAGMFARSQTAFVLRDYFPEFAATRPEVAQACTLYEAEFAAIRALSGGFTYQIPSQMVIKAPTE